MSSADSADESYVNSSDFSDIREEYLVDLKGLLCKSVDEIRKTIEGKNDDYIFQLLNFSFDDGLRKIYNLLFAIEMLRKEELSNKVDEWLKDNMLADIDLRFYQYLNGIPVLHWEDVFKNYKDFDPYIIDKLMCDKGFSKEDAKYLKDKNLTDRKAVIDFINLRYNINIRAMVSELDSSYYSESSLES